MRTFLRETWELWYWAFFCPRKLQERLDEWAPPEVVDGREGDKTGNEDEPKDTSLRHVLWVRTKPGTRASRLLAQYALLLAVSTLPLAIETVALAGPRYLVLAFAVLLASFGCGGVCASLGLILPPLCAWIYLWSPSTAGVALDNIARSIPPGTLPATGVTFAALGLIALVGERTWRRGWLKAGRAILIGGMSSAVVFGFWMVVKDPVPAAFAGFPTAFALLLSTIEEPRRSRKSRTAIEEPRRSREPRTAIEEPHGSRESRILAHLMGGIAGTAGLFHLLLAEWVIALAAPTMSVLFGTLLAVAGSLHFLLRSVERVDVLGFTGAVWRSALVGLVGGAFVPFVGGFLVVAAAAPLEHLLVMAYLFGYALAPMRSGVDVDDLKDLFQVTIEHGLKGIEFFLFSLPQTRSLRWLLLGGAGCVMLGSSHGYWALLAMPAVLVGYTRVLPDLLLLAAEAAIRAHRARQASPGTLIRWLDTMPPFALELAPLPIPGHGRILTIACQADPWSTLKSIESAACIRAPWCYWRTLGSVATAIVDAIAALDSAERNRLVRRWLLAVKDAAGIAKMRKDGSDVLLFFLPPQVYLSDADAGEASSLLSRELAELLPALTEIASDVRAALDEDLPVQRERGLEHAIARVERLHERASGLGLGEADSAEWRRVLDHWRSTLREGIEAQLASAGRVEIVQPFQTGNPIRADRHHLFKGRRRLAADVVHTARGQGRPTLVLHGPRRCGKSSFLLNLSRLLPEDLVPVYVDLQSQAMTSSEGDFCFGLVRAAIRDLRSRGLEAPAAERATFRASPYPALEDWLDGLRPLLGQRRLLFCLDEFEKLGEAMARGKVGLPLFDELRHLAQHREELGFILCGAQTLEELGPQWTSYFINARPVEILYLDREEARELLLDPDPAFNLTYDVEVVDTVIEMTSCQPYLVQLLGEAMVRVANRHGVRRIDLARLEEAVGEALASGTIYFANVWEETTGTAPDEVAAGQAWLRALAQGRPLPPMDELTRSSLRRLQRYHVVEGRDGDRFEIPLVSRWIRERTGGHGAPPGA
ncbi:AAA family ATPase [Sorangium sp. So ce131]|uniref:AAA family ATPase n=1 Tax=Sorangium sp. So ce131 TaxID=3133282 RepID=UPI003F6132EC